MKRKIVMASVLASVMAFSGLWASESLASIPKALRGKYCPEGNKKCSPREFDIQAKQVWSESHGGCMQVETIEVIEGNLHLICKGEPKVILEPLPKKKIRITVAEDEPIIIQKIK